MIADTGPLNAGGIWPPPNGPQNIAYAWSTISIPTRISPLA
jgi:hypothetical protein